MSAVLRAALRYAARGWLVFPVEPGGKRPLAELVPHGSRDATTDAATITAWWLTVPGANVAIATGAASGLVVVDVDGQAGAASLRELVGRCGRFAAAWVRTGSGGWHSYLRHPSVEVRNSAGKLGRGLDVRGDGGSITAPPSLHASGRRYQWLGMLPATLPPMPAWMVELAQPPPMPAPQTIRLASGSRLQAYVTAAIELEAEEVAATPEGSRNHALNRAAFRIGQLLGTGALSADTVEAALLAAAVAAGLREIESRRTIRSGFRAGRRSPREVALEDESTTTPRRRTA